MITVKLKIVEEGIKHPVEQLKHAISEALLQDDLVVTENSNLELKIKFTQENNQDIVFLRLRESDNKQKLNEKVIPYIESSWLQDISSEAHALLAPAAVSS